MKKFAFLSPFQKFVKLESFAGILLLIATVVAIIWANSPLSYLYKDFLEYKIGIYFQDFELIKPAILWINDALMAIFFFLIGLELKRELLIGEISSVKKAMLPLIGALGGVVVPIAIYLLLNENPGTVQGWGIPMATDIAFALAILTILGKRVPLSLKIFLTAFAIIDDIAAVLVIAIFYSTEIVWSFILIGIILIVLLGIIYRKFHYSAWPGLIIAMVTWVLFLKSGIHPTIAGVFLALTIPIKKRIKISQFSEKLGEISKELTTGELDESHILTHDEMNSIDNLDNLIAGARSPLQYLEHKLHNIVAYFILPVFAFANAGVEISAGFNFDFALVVNIAISLFVGKFIGVSLFSYLGIKLNITELPTGARFSHILGIAVIAGVGFTMSIFIANLAFGDNLIFINSAKIGIIIGSAVSGILGYLILKLTLRN